MKNSGLDLVISRVQGAVPIAILRPRGNLDRFTYLELINKSKEVYDSGPLLFLPITKEIE